MRGSIAGATINELVEEPKTFEKGTTKRERDRVGQHPLGEHPLADIIHRNGTFPGFRGSRRKRVPARSRRGRNETKIRVKPVLREVADRNSAERGREESAAAVEAERKRERLTES